MAQQIADITNDDPRNILIHGVAHLSPQVAAQLRQACLVYLATAAHFLATPDASSPLKEMAKSIVEQIAHALVSSQLRHHAKSSFNKRRKLIQKAEDYSAHHTAQPLRINKLCRDIGVSERTLRDAFQSLTDRSPLDYLKTQRLNQVHRTLLDSDPTTVLIKQIAYNNGFSHLGQFSQDYKQLFSELPSETLQRG